MMMVASTLTPAMLKMVVHTETELLAEVLHPGLVSHQVAAMLSSQVSL